MNQTAKPKTQSKIAKYVSKFFQQLDKKIQDKAKNRSCCCGGKSEKDKSC